MVRRVKILRIALAILFVAFLALLGLSFTRNSQRQRAVSDPVTSPMRQGETPQLVAWAFEDVQTIGGRVVSRIRARRTMGFGSGWYTLEDVHLTIYRSGDQTWEIAAPEAQFQIDTRAAEAKGGVRISSGDRVRIETDSIDFDGTRLANRIPVRFLVDEWEGKAGAVDLNVATEHLRLHDGVEATRRIANEPPLMMRALEADFDRLSNEAVFRGQARIERQGDTLETEAITARVDAERRVLSALEGCCGVAFHLSSGSELASGSSVGETTVRGERFFTDVGPEGKVRAIFIEGAESPARAVLAGPPPRTLTAGQFRIVLADQGVAEIEASGRAKIEESGQTPRSVSGSKMVAYFDAARQRPTSAVVEGNLEYRDARNRATAHRGTFDFLADRVVLDSVRGSLPSIESDGHRLTGQKIELSQRAGLLRAEGFVKARFIDRKGGSTLERSGVFPSSRSPVYVNSDSVVLQQQAESAHFRGNVRAWQDENILLSKELKIEQGGKTLVAEGEVRAVLYNAREESSSSPVKASAETLTARRDERTANLRGGVRIEDQGRVLTSESATFFFDAAQRLERVEAAGGVEVAERAASRSGKGERLVYHVSRRMIHLEGSPATVTDPQGSVEGSEIVFDLARDRVEVLRGEGQTEATYRPEGSR
ncbi:MAG TPA: LptA/OstA family protein [Thermoanaerobaculia bacterium]|nr:LptA/OstA family protein [Thermoanaerobaculia bacterium]